MDHLKEAQSTWRIFEDFRDNADLEAEEAKARDKLCKNKAQTSTFIRNFLKKTLTEDQKSQLEDPFLYSNLRQTRECTLDDVLNQLATPEFNSRYAGLRHFIENKVNLTEDSLHGQSGRSHDQVGQNASEF